MKYKVPLFLILVWFWHASYADSSVLSYDTLSKIEHQEKYADGHWNIYDDKGNLIRQEERVTVGKETFTVKVIDFTTGKLVLVENRPVTAFYLRNLFLFFIIILGSLLIRIPINNLIYKREDYVFTRNMEARIATTFTFWWMNYKADNRSLAIISNILSVIGLGTFIACIVCIVLIKI